MITLITTYLWLQLAFFLLQNLILPPVPPPLPPLSPRPPPPPPRRTNAAAGQGSSYFVHFQPYAKSLGKNSCWACFHRTWALHFVTVQMILWQNLLRLKQDLYIKRILSGKVRSLKRHEIFDSLFFLHGPHMNRLPFNFRENIRLQSLKFECSQQLPTRTRNFSLR